MSRKSYEAAVKLNTGEVVIYHNINTGLFKFHKFVVEKFSENQKWLYYKVRRKDTKELIGIFRNVKEGKKQELVKVYLKPIPNERQTGYFLPIPYERNGFQIIRNIFVSNSQILEVKDIAMTIPKWLFEEATSKGKADLYEYYHAKNHQIEPEDIRLGKVVTDFIIKEIESQEGTAPVVDYP